MSWYVLKREILPYLFDVVETFETTEMAIITARVRAAQNVKPGAYNVEPICLSDFLPPPPRELNSKPKRIRRRSN